MLARLALALLAALLLLPATAQARRALPADWLGVNLEVRPLVKAGALDSELAVMRRDGVRAARLAVYWSQVEPTRGHRDFREVDRLVRAAATARVALVPVVLGAPGWATDAPAVPISPPRDPADYARFMTALVRRYGPTGTYWARHPSVRKLPVRRWQVWNEISNPYYWGSTWPFAYPRLLAASYAAIKAADRGATVLMAGINTLGAAGAAPYTSWQGLDEIYRQLDAQGLGRPFDVAAVHVFTRQVRDALRVVQETRRVMAAHGDADRPLRITEISWPASQGHLRDDQGRPAEFFAATTPRGMARRLGQGLRLLAANAVRYGLAGVDWFQWSSPYTGRRDPFQYGGLRRIGPAGRLTDTRALTEFRAVARSLAGR